jgi:hypothetical protein
VTDDSDYESDKQVRGAESVGSRFAILQDNEELQRDGIEELDD